jgi:Stress responsive A/B Barrel Domain
MFVHAVYFWLKPDLNEADQAQFWAGVRSLGTIKSVKHCFIGTPAATDRPIIDRSYSCALTVVFAGDAEQEAYQVDPIHDAFRIECAHLWERILIYDSMTN